MLIWLRERDAFVVLPHLQLQGLSCYMLMLREGREGAFVILTHLWLHAGVALRRFTALHCALAREFVLPLKSVGEVQLLFACHAHSCGPLALQSMDMH